MRRTNFVSEFGQFPRLMMLRRVAADAIQPLITHDMDVIMRETGRQEAGNSSKVFGPVCYVRVTWAGLAHYIEELRRESARE